MSIPFDLKGLDHVVLRVRDIEASLQFYEKILGCSLERELPELGLYQLRAGAHLIDLVLIGTKLGGDAPPAMDRRNQDHFCISVVPKAGDQVPEVLTAYLSAHGVKVLESGERYGAEGVGWSVYVADPDGNTVEIKPTNDRHG